jgi:Holliday junction DNA helicase RuvB
MEPDTIEQDIGRADPQKLSQIRGQPQVTELLEMHLQGHLAMRPLCGDSAPAFGPTMLTGPPGCGKTLVARGINTEMGNDNLIETNGETLNCKQELYRTLIDADSKTTIFIDEAHVLDRTAQHILLTVLSEGILRIPSRVYSVGSHPVRLAKFTMILATTHEHLLHGALRNRMRICCRFDYYKVDDLVEIVRQRADALRWRYESDAVLQAIAQRAKRTPRLALQRNLYACWHVAVGRGSQMITPGDTERAFRCLQIDELGLEQNDRAYLELLLKHGPTPVGVLASRMMQPSLTVQRVIEPYLLKEELITKDKSSRRAIAERGKRHMEDNSLSPSERRLSKDVSERRF